VGGFVSDATIGCSGEDLKTLSYTSKQQPISEGLETGATSIPSPILCDREGEILERLDFARANGTWLAKFYVQDVEYLMDILRGWVEADRGWN
jgi:hypothetical protein